MVMNPIRPHMAPVLALGLAAATAIGIAGDSGRKEIGRTTERELNVVLSTGFGKIIIEKGEPEKAFVAERSSGKEPNLPFSVSYEIRNRIGYLDLSIGEEIHSEGKKGSFKISGLESSTWLLRFTDAIPISFDIELGVAKGIFDLSGLRVKDFKLSAGASDVALSFDRPNVSDIHEMTIECGIGKFEGRNLGNANFKSFRFEGGVGSATLDFNGAINHEVDIDIEVGMGVCTIIIPKEAGARVFFQETLVSKIDFGRTIHPAGENQFVSENFTRASGRMNIRIDTGLGKVRVRQE